MRLELDQKLVERYPEIFRQRHMTVQESAMAWGFECGDGWYPLIDTCCQLIMARVECLRRDLADYQLRRASSAPIEEWLKAHYAPERQQQLETQLADALAELPVAVQVKEKFGGLRFYADGGTEWQRAYIKFAESMSYRTCEHCGATDTAVTSRHWGWIRTLCDDCTPSTDTDGKVLDLAVDDITER